MQNKFKSARPYARNHKINIGTGHKIRKTTADGKGTGSMTRTDAATGRQTTRTSRPTATALHRERAGGGRCETETELIVKGVSFRCKTVRREMLGLSTARRHSASRTRASATLVTIGFRALPPPSMAPGIRRRSKTGLSVGRTRSVPRAPRASSGGSLTAGGPDGTACAGRPAAAGAMTAGAGDTGSVDTTNGSLVDGDILSWDVFGCPEPM